MYITGYPITVTERASYVIVRLDDRIWHLFCGGWYEVYSVEQPMKYEYFSDHYDAFEREHFESTMVLSGELVKPLMDGAL